MTRFISGFLLFLTCFPPGLLAQNSPPPNPSVASEWDLQANLTGLNTRFAQLDQMLAQIDPNQWRDATAAQSYQQQLTSIRQQIAGMKGLSTKLAADPEKLSLVLEGYMRIQAVETFLPALATGIRRYQNPSLADLLDDTFSETADTRERVKSYLMDLVKLKETELDIMNKEAQRCREQVLRTQ